MKSQEHKVDLPGEEKVTSQPAPENRQMRERLSFTGRHARESILECLYKLQPSGDGKVVIRDFQKILEQYGVIFTTKYFVVMLLKFEQLLQSEQGLSLTMGVMGQISRIVEEQFNQNHRVYVVRDVQHLVCIINIFGYQIDDRYTWTSEGRVRDNQWLANQESLEPPRRLAAEMKACASCVVNMAQKKLGIYLSALISRLHGECNAIQAAYADVVQLEEYKISMKLKTRILQFDDVHCR